MIECLVVIRHILGGHFHTVIMNDLSVVCVFVEIVIVRHAFSFLEHHFGRGLVVRHASFVGLLVHWLLLETVA
jgi:hypothetical protein